MVSPKKRLGQHFLKDQNIARKIINSIENKKLPVIEVGPGTGVLTYYMMQANQNFFALDVDNESIDYLKENYPDFSDKFILADFLKINLRDYFQNELLVLGNFPYNISSQLFFRILENREQVSEVVCMIQKEVAERICATPGSKVYGILSVLLQAFYVPKYLFTVSEKVFLPPPKVKSAVIRLIRNNNRSLECDEQLFFLVVKKAFNQRRKMLSNSLKEFNISEIEESYLKNRPEQLCVQDFINITKKIKLNL